jgi:hypothetical protein
VNLRNPWNQWHARRMDRPVYVIVVMFSVVESIHQSFDFWSQEP